MQPKFKIEEKEKSLQQGFNFRFVYVHILNMHNMERKRLDQIQDSQAGTLEFVSRGREI